VRRGLLFIVSAPSGAGKTTLVERLVSSDADIVRSRSYTSRKPRPNEVDGVDYNFIDNAKFLSMLQAGEFLESATIFGNRYGTSVADTKRCLKAGCDVVLVIDVQGARQLKSSGVSVISVFVLPPSFSVLEKRLRNRSVPHASEEEIRGRLDSARHEVSLSKDYDYVVVNDDVERCVDQLRDIVIAERLTISEKTKSSSKIVDMSKSQG
jgi:guanylate kinase